MQHTSYTNIESLELRTKYRKVIKNHTSWEVLANARLEEFQKILKNSFPMKSISRLVAGFQVVLL